MANFIRNLLTQRGYSIVALPKTGIHPLQLLSDEDSHLSSLEADIELLFEPGKVPKVSPNTKVAPISGRKALEFKLSAGMDFLKGIFKALRLNSAKLEAKANASRDYKVEFSYENVKEDKVSNLALDQFLSAATAIEGKFRTYEERLKNSELYVITSVLKSNSFSIKITDANGQGVDLNTALQGMVEANVKIDRNHSDGYTITHKGEALLIFAFKAVQIYYDKAQWWEFWKSDEASFRIREEEGLVLKADEVTDEDVPVNELYTGDDLVEV